jgi:hypothetical protein
VSDDNAVSTADPLVTVTVFPCNAFNVKPMTVLVLSNAFDQPLVPVELSWRVKTNDAAEGEPDADAAYPYNAALSYPDVLNG